MNILEALRFPLRKPSRLLSFAFLHTIVFWIFVDPMVYDERYPGSVSGVLLFSLFLIWILVNAICLHTALVESIRRLSSGQNSLPRLSLTLLKIGGIRPFVSSVILFVYFIVFASGMVILPFMLRSYSSAPDGVTFVEALNRFALGASVLILATMFSLVYVVGIARYAVAGRGSVRDAFKANVSLLLNNKLASCRYVLLQLVIIGVAALILELGAEIGYQIRPRGLGYYPEDMRNLPRQAISMFVVLYALLYFWNASVHLLAQYATMIGLAQPPLKRSS